MKLLLLQGSCGVHFILNDGRKVTFRQLKHKPLRKSDLQQ